MTKVVDLDRTARAIIDANTYLTLATADSDGRPWASPVFFATADYREFFWISAQTVTHSRNIAARAEVGIVIFDSTVAPGSGEAVYLTATASLVPDADIERALRVYPGRRGWHPLTRADVSAPSPYRLYHAVATEHSTLCPRDREPCAAHGLAYDHRTSVNPAG